MTDEKPSPPEHKPAAKESPAARQPVAYGEPWVAAAAGVVAAVALMAVATLGMPIYSCVLAGVLGFVDLWLLGSRWMALRTARSHGTDRPSGRAWPALAAALVLITLAVVAPVLGKPAHSLSVDHGQSGLWPLRGLALTAAIAAGVISISALLDWAIINLRLKGVLGDWTLPCQPSSTNWGFYTRLWLAHRVVASLVVQLGIASLIGFTAALIIRSSSSLGKTATAPTDVSGKTLAAIIVPVGATLLIFFLNRFLPVWSLVLNPRIKVGDQMELAEEYGTGVENRPVYYAVDVSAEGIKLLELKEGKPKGGAARTGRREHDRSLNLIDLPRLLRVRSDFVGCAERCSMANHNCPIGLARPVETEPDPPPRKVRSSKAASPTTSGPSTTTGRHD